ncbi:MAG TPA: hypothetical protein VFD43_00505, partial [Planctomycetota bacterium]|nr:hypothetical protein [Planctomycetota bacterium]
GGGGDQHGDERRDPRHRGAGGSGAVELHSFTHGDEVELAETWVARLETEVAAQVGGGARCEALNFGVPGYGLDQAWLRWRQDGAGFAPHVVVLGFVAEDVYRLVNVMRPLYQPVVTIPFSKPRFVADGGARPLRLVNQPTLPPGSLAAELEDFARSPLARDEAYFDASDYRAAWWQGSRLLAWAADLPRTDPIAREPADAPRVLSPQAEAGRLALQIVAGFRAEVEARGGRFLLVHLPRRPDLDAWRAREPLAYAELLAALARTAELVDPCPALAARADAELFERQGHYGPAGHAIVAEVLGPAIVRVAPLSVPEASPAGR